MKEKLASIIAAAAVLAAAIPVSADTLDESAAIIADAAAEMEYDAESELSERIEDAAFDGAAESAEDMTDEIFFDFDDAEPEDLYEDDFTEAAEEIQGDAALSEASGKCGDNLTWVLDDKGTLTISGTGEMNGSPWHDISGINVGLKKVIIKNGVSNISRYAFGSCSGLRSITIPNSVTSISCC